MAIREGRWDCPSCGSTGIYGRHVDCPGCGKPRPQGVRFYLTDDAPVITDAAQLREAKAGADWVCEHCGASNRATEPDCGGCGAPRGSSPAQRVVDYDLNEVPRSGETAPRGLEGRVMPAADTPTQPGGLKKPATPRDTCLGCGCMFFIAMLVVGLVGGLIQTCAGVRPVGGEDLTPAMVTAKRWERSFRVEQRRVVSGTGWDLPDSAQVVRTERRRRGWGQEVDYYETGTQRVQRSRRVADGTRTRTREVDERVRTGTRTYVCGQRDLGNGYFEDIECTEPVYETRSRTERYEEPVYRDETYYEDETVRTPVYKRVAVYDTFFVYRVATWGSVEVRQARGDTTAPVWPDTTLRPNQRIRDRKEGYWMTFRQAGGAPYGTRLPLSVWERWRVGQRAGLRMEDGTNGARPAIFPPDSLSICRRWHLGRDDDNPPGDSIGCSPRPR